MKKYYIIRTVSIVTLFFSAISLYAACKKTPAPSPEPEQKPKIELLSPADNSTLDLGKGQGISFEWKPAEKINSYKLKLSLDNSFANSVSILATGNPLVMTADYFDSQLGTLGIGKGLSADVYWTVTAGGNEQTENFTRKMSVTRKKADSDLPYEERVAEKLTVKVAVIYEDPIVPGTGGRRLHEVCTTPGYGFKWNDPRQQCKQYEADFEEVSHGVLDYVIVHEFESDRFFSFHSSDSTYLTMDDVLEIFRTGPVPGIGEGIEYDYVGMAKQFGLGEMRDKGEIQEVWVYTHPASGMYESRLMGQGAFWLNSPGISTGAPCKDLMSVMFCNYERGVESALHSYGHRVESIMNEVYGGWNFENKNRKSALTSWERFCGYKLNYNKFDAGNTNIGLVHFPPNGVKDYDYYNTSYINTYADEWVNYPNVPEDKSRRVNCTEWKSTEYGYMKWYFSHLPHFKGINPDPNDLHLNNWWYYVVDYNAARRYERELQMGL